MAGRNTVNDTTTMAATKSKATVPKKNAAPRPKKAKFGQNFLVDPVYAEKIIASLGDVSQRRVIEIGAGQGVLTDLLVRRAGRVISIELDRVLSAQLRMRYATQPNLEVLEGDILKIDFANVLGPRPGALAGVTPRPPEPAAVVGNIPYYITSDILLRLYAFHRFFDVIVLMVQKEVADRIAAAPGGREYGLLSATTQLYARVENLFTVPPGAFNPPPQVYSSVVRLTVAPRFDTLGIPEKEFIEFLKLSFAQKRKTLVNNLKDTYAAKAVQQALKKAGIRADARAETLPLEKAAAVYKNLAVRGS